LTILIILDELQMLLYNISFEGVIMDLSNGITITLGHPESKDWLFGMSIGFISDGEKIEQLKEIWKKFQVDDPILKFQNEKVSDWYHFRVKQEDIPELTKAIFEIGAAQITIVDIERY
jgi:hypothetical protein